MKSLKLKKFLLPVLAVAFALAIVVSPLGMAQADAWYGGAFPGYGWGGMFPYSGYGGLYGWNRAFAPYYGSAFYGSLFYPNYWGGLFW